jgi:predicted P-loop ATPase
MSDVLRLAKYYAEKMNWAVFPAPQGEKKSRKSAEHSNGRKWGATKDSIEIEGDFIRWPDANVGIVTGEISNIFVIEADTLEGHEVDGIASLDALQALHGTFPPTLQAESPSGSIHYYFRHPGLPVKTCAGELAPGVDIRGDGGMVIVPPSVRPAKEGRPGGTYKWRNPEQQVAEAPTWLLTLVQALNLPSERTAAARAVTATGTPIPSYKIDSARELYTWLRDNDAITNRRDWILVCGGAAKYEFGDDGFELFEIICHGGGADNTAKYQWNSLKPDHKNPATLLGVMDIAHRAGWKGSVEKTAHGTFKDVLPAIAAVAAATPPPAGSTSMLGHAQATSDLGLPILAAFNAAHTIAHAADAPTFPIEIKTPPLRGPLTEAIGKLYTLADRDGAALRYDTFGELLGVLSQAHDITLDTVVARIRSAGVVVPEGRLKRSRREFENAVVQEARTGNGWHTSSKGNKPDPNISENADVLLAMLHTELRFNEFARHVEFSRDGAPWRMLDSTDLRAIFYEANSAVHLFHASMNFLDTCMTTIARRRTYDPLTDYLDTLRWDGEPRLDKWLHHACGTPADAYHAAVGRNVMGGLVKRARHPGCKHDEILLLIGRQGVTKSGLAASLMPDPTWYADTINLRRNLGDLIPEISGKWMIEWSELASMGKTAVEDVKAFISRSTDRYTKKFENIAGDHPRRMIFIATSNDDEPLQDESGGRRFLPVRVLREIDIPWIEANRDQMFAEASALHANGDRFGIPRELWGVAAEHQEAARSRPLHEEFIADWFSGRAEPFYITSKDLVEALRRSSAGTNKISEACKRVGLEKRRSNRITDFWITAGADVSATPRVRLAEQRVGETHSKVTWQWPLVAVRQPAPPPPY